MDGKMTEELDCSDTEERQFSVSFWIDDNYYISPQIVDSLYNPNNDFMQRYYE